MNTVTNGFEEVDIDGYILSGGKCCLTRLIPHDVVWRFCPVLLGQLHFIQHRGFRRRSIGFQRGLAYVISAMHGRPNHQAVSHMFGRCKQMLF
jgi:hypothetical protein